MQHALPDGYRWRQGSMSDRTLLDRFARLTYGELFPETANFNHLNKTIALYLSQATPIWWVEPTDLPSEACDPIGLLWAGIVVDQSSGDRHLQILLLYVQPTYRRQGIGAALMSRAEALAHERGDRHISVQTFTHNQAAVHLYERLGYHPREVVLVKKIAE
ncbi:MAG: GNAT family N-acetyltransferase [Cyanobacteria bacterium J06641_5]